MQESDISWTTLRRIVQDWAGHAVELAEVQPLLGGCINTTLALTMKDGGRAVLKISPHRVNRELPREAHQLELLRRLGLPVPKVYACHVGSLEHPHSYLLMEYVEGVDLGKVRHQCSTAEYEDLQRHLADLVTTIHANTADQYFRESPDDTERFSSWTDFYHHICDPILHEVEKSDVISVKVRKQIHRVHGRLDMLLAHDDRPRLVHWDLWGANMVVNRNPEGQWRITALLDPNCKYAHAEAELAYLELFHTVTPAFMKAYQHAFPIDKGYHQVRRAVYQLYPLLNHVRLFGHDYLKPLLAAVDRVAPLV